MFTSCADEPAELPRDDALPAMVSIMPLGASRVEGARPAFESYRYELWKLLVADGIAFDFVGTRQDEASYPRYIGLHFDTDHEGRSGITSAGIREGIGRWLREVSTPDIVLFSSPGGNDALTLMPYEDTIANINAIIDRIQVENPNVTIVLERFAPPHPDDVPQEVLAYYETLLADIVRIAAEQTTTTSTVLTVDMVTGFDEDAFLADDVHYNEAGARFIARRYDAVLEDLVRESR